MLKKYLLFWGQQYYPGPGFDCFKGSYDTPQEAIDAFLQMHKDYFAQRSSENDQHMWVQFVNAETQTYINIRPSKWGFARNDYGDVLHL